MPYAPVTIPFRGVHVDSGYSSLPPGFAADAINVVPYDAYKGKLRLGQRRALLGALEFNDVSPAVTRELQVILRADAYVGGILLQRCVVVAGGEVFIIDPGSTTPTQLAYDAGITKKIKSTGYVGAAVFGDHVYFADGACYRKIKITDATPTITVWSGAESHIRGPNPHGTPGNEQGFRAQLLVRFGARLALASIESSPNNWFLSAISDPEDWNPSSGGAEDALAADSSIKFGLVGEPIVALVPIAESGLLIAGRHTMTYLSADPVFTETARMIELSRSVGIVSSRAWCASDAQTIYVMSQDGLYRVQPNEQLVTQSGRITGGRLDTFFQQQKFDALNCVLGYDAEGQNVHCLMSRLDLPASSVHLMYSQATDAFWPYKTGWPPFHAPTCCGDFPFGDARAPILAFGSSEGFVGWFDRDLTSGVDGQAATGYKTAGFNVTNDQAADFKIVSRLTIGPVLERVLGQVMMRDVRIELTMDEPQEETAFAGRLSGPFASLLSGQTAEEAIGENIVAVSTVFDPDYPLVVLDGGDHTAFTPTTTYDCGAPSGSFTLGICLLFPPEVAPRTYTTADTLISDPIARSYVYESNRIRSPSATAPGSWIIEHVEPPGPHPVIATRDTSLPETSLDTPGGTYVYDAVPSGLTLPTSILPPRIKVSSATYNNTNSISLGSLLPGRNDALRCRVRDQAIYVRLESLGVPWALERMSVLVDQMGHTKNVKGTY
jgi:hypothetical protein